MKCTLSLKHSSFVSVSSFTKTSTSACSALSAAAPHSSPPSSVTPTGRAACGCAESRETRERGKPTSAPRDPATVIKFFAGRHGCVEWVRGAGAHPELEDIRPEGNQPRVRAAQEEPPRGRVRVRVRDALVHLGEFPETKQHNNAERYPCQRVSSSLCEAALRRGFTWRARHAKRTHSPGVQQRMPGAHASALHRKNHRSHHHTLRPTPRARCEAKRACRPRGTSTSNVLLTVGALASVHTSSGCTNSRVSASTTCTST